MQYASGGDGKVTVFDQLGVYRILAEAQDTGTIERFVREWLGPLLDHDAARRTDLVPTLSSYLEHGGSYDAAAKAVAVHRSTLKYRLQRIREISGLDLSDPETQFSLQLATRARDTLAALRDSRS
jgi:DNA-binding PucR family transcriptional regulator